MNIRIGKENLAGEAWNEKVHGLVIKWVRDVSVQKHFRARYPKLRNDLNELTTISFRTARLHRSEADAHAFILDHGRKVPTEGVVLIDQQFSAGAVIRRFEQGFITSMSARTIGVTSLHDYEIIGTEVRLK